MTMLAADSMKLVGWGVLGGVSLMLSALFSGLETGNYVLNRVRLELRVARGEVKARRVARLLARSQELVSTVLIGNNLANYLVTAAAVGFLVELGVEDVALLTTLFITPLIFVAGEMVPKNVFRVSADTLVYRWQWMLLAARWFFRCTGLVQLVTAFSQVLVRFYRGANVVQAADDPRRRVREILAEGYAHGALSQIQSGMAERLTRLQITEVSQVMVELPRVVSISIDCPREQFVRTLAGHNYSRMPVWSGKPRNIVGLVNIYDVLLDRDPAASPAKHLRNILELSANTDVGRSIVMLQRSRQTMGLVRNSAGQAIGIVTMKDLVEEIVGELQAW